jgi:hypothetical protein
MCFVAIGVVHSRPSVGDDYFDPPGRGIAVAMRDPWRREGFTAQEEDNLRDCGRSIAVAFPTFVIEIALARAAGDNHWIARVAPLKEPGLLSRLFGAKFVSREREVLSISRCMHNWLVEAGCEGVLWRIDGFPEPANGHPEPVAIGEDAAD